MHIDWLTLIETAERAVEWTESTLRRHARTILLAFGALALVAAWLAWPMMAARMQPPPLLRPQARPRASASVAVAGHRGPSPSPSILASPSKAPVAPFIYVHVAGAVAQPGVIRLPSGARGFQAVRAAGGALAEADLTRINLARKLQDEGMLVIPRQGEPAPPADAAQAPADPAQPPANAGQASSAPLERPSTAGDPPPPGGKAALDWLTQHPLSVNRADAAALQAVPGVGPGLARAIVAWRTQHGPFARVEDLRKVPRFGEKLFARTHRCFVP